MRSRRTKVNHRTCITRGLRIGEQSLLFSPERHAPCPAAKCRFTNYGCGGRHSLAKPRLVKPFRQPRTSALPRRTALGRAVAVDARVATRSIAMGPAASLVTDPLRTVGHG